MIYGLLRSATISKVNSLPPNQFLIYNCIVIAGVLCYLSVSLFRNQPTNPTVAFYNTIQNDSPFVRSFVTLSCCS